jgi:hypothetical protein
MADVEEVDVVVAHHECATLRVGDVFLKIDADQTRTDVEVEAMAMAPIPTPEILWRKPPVLALAALPGTALGSPWSGESLDELASRLDGECEWLVTNGVLPTDLVTRNRRVAEAVLHEPDFHECRSAASRGPAPASWTGSRNTPEGGQPVRFRRCAGLVWDAGCCASGCAG